MTEKHMEKLLKYVTIKEDVCSKQLARFEREKMDTETRRLYTGALEEWHAYATVLDLIKDEKQLNKMLAIWKD